MRLRRAGVAAAIDISDGLSIDLQRLCAASEVSAEISFVPTAKRATIDDALHGGEDYELLFTAPRRFKIPASIDRLVTPIGEVLQGAPGQIYLLGQPLEPKGFDHFG